MTPACKIIGTLHQLRCELCELVGKSLISDVNITFAVVV